MKRTCFLLGFTLVCIVISSCDMMYFTKGDTAYIEAKRTIEPFNHLKEPIVVTMPVFENSYLFGNENWANRKDRLGDIFVVIDIETDRVHDWIFFPGNHGYTNWRCVEVGENPKVYCSAGANSRLLGCLNPTKTCLDVYSSGISEVVMSYNTSGNYLIIPNYTYDEHQEKFIQHMNIMNVRTGEVAKGISVSTNKPGFFVQTDFAGNFWFTYLNDGVYQIRYLNPETYILSDVIAEFPYRYDKDDRYYEYNIDYVSETHIFIACVPLGSSVEGQTIIIINRNEKESEPIYLSIPDELDANGYYLYEIKEVKGKFYGIFPDWNMGTEVYLAEIDIETGKITPLNTVLNIDFTETVYVRGSRLYLMKSRNTSDIYYTYYDFATNEVGKIVNIKFEDVVN